MVRLSIVAPLVIYKRIVKKRNMMCSGNYNVLGTIFGSRHNKWLNGTSYALCIVFGGSNSDVSSNDHMFIIMEAMNILCGKVIV